MSTTGGICIVNRWSPYRSSKPLNVANSLHLNQQRDHGIAFTLTMMMMMMMSVQYCWLLCCNYTPIHVLKDKV